MIVIHVGDKFEQVSQPMSSSLVVVGSSSLYSSAVVVRTYILVLHPHFCPLSIQTGQDDELGGEDSMIGSCLDPSWVTCYRTWTQKNNEHLIVGRAYRSQ